MPTRAGRPTATELMDLLDRGECSSEELARSFVARIEGFNAAVNAVVHIEPDRVIADARAADASRRNGIRTPLLGLPVSIKDSIAVAGMPHLSGSFARVGVVPASDATVVARLRAAGAIVLCKTNIPEYTWSTETDNAVSGRTNNPYDLERTAGGSSGGEAALHALGGAPAGIGSDGLNSIRVPAHFCGTVGLRPSAGTVPETGAWPPTRCTGMLDMSTLGPMAASVGDLDLLLRVIRGPDDIDPFVAAVPLNDYRTIAVSGLRVGLYTSDGVATPTEGTRAAVHRAGRVLEAEGATVDLVEPPDLTSVADTAFRMMAADGGARARRDLAAAEGRHHPQIRGLLETLEPLALTAAGFFELMETWATMRSVIRRFVSFYDVVLCPVAAGPAPLHGRRPSDDGPLESYDEFAYSFTYAIAGLPSASVPCGAERGLPIGVQVVGPTYHDGRVIAVAHLLEQALANEVPLPPPQ